MNKTSHYVSEIDQLLAELRLHVPESNSQAQERKKYNRISQLRDHRVIQEKVEIWEEF